MYDGHRWKITGNKAFPPKPNVHSDALSVLAFSDEDLVSDEEGSIAASKPPYPANKPSTQANEPPTRANEPPIGVFEPQTQAVQPCIEAGNQNTGATVSPNGIYYYDSDFRRSSRKPKEDFVVFYNKK